MSKPNPTRILIATSLLLNALLVGGILGQVWKGPPPPPPPPWGRNMPDMASTLPAEKREMVQAAMKQMGTETDKLREQMFMARQESKRILKTDPFDKDAYLKQVEVIKGLTNQLADRMADTMAGLAQKLTAEERSQLTDMMRMRHFGRGDMPPPHGTPPGEMPPPLPPGGPDGDMPSAGDTPPPPPPGDEPPSGDEPPPPPH